jgi:hypothetical protein
METITDNAPTAQDTATPLGVGISKVIEINVREWFDKVNGNSYWSAHVFITESTDKIPTGYVFTFQYGYGDHSRAVVLNELSKLGEISGNNYQTLRDSGVMVIHHKRDSRKRELMFDKDINGMRKVAPSVYCSH